MNSFDDWLQEKLDEKVPGRDPDEERAWLSDNIVMITDKHKELEG